MLETGTVVGYDPGGNGKHGVSAIRISGGAISDVKVQTLDTAEAVLAWIEPTNDLVAIGIDTLSCWSTGYSGWRGADRWLRKKYPNVQRSVVSPNGLYGSMGLNGMAVLLSLRRQCPELPATETHPKVLYWALTGCKYDYLKTSEKMNAELCRFLGRKVATANDHEWDACISAVAAFNGSTGRWTHDLLEEEVLSTAQERLVEPAGSVHYWWPE